VICHPVVLAKAGLGVRELAPAFATPPVSLKPFIKRRFVNRKSGGKPPHSKNVGAPTWILDVVVNIGARTTRRAAVANGAGMIGVGGE